MIVGVAIRWGAYTLALSRPARHDAVIMLSWRRARFDRGLAVERRRKPSGDVQGFVDDAGRFLDRRQAYAHAYACGQPRRLRGPRGEDLGWGVFGAPGEHSALYSEDTW